MVFVGIDWAEAGHAVCVVDQGGQVLARGQVAEGLEGLARLHALLAAHGEETQEVVIGIETERGLLVRGLSAAGYAVYVINPRAVSRYRERHAVSGAKSDPGDAKVLADLVRTDRHNHRLWVGDSELAEAVRVLARSHQTLVWTRQRQVNQLRNALREFYPAAGTAFAGELDSRDALAILGRAPTPRRGRTLTQTQIVATLRRAGRRRNCDRRAGAIQTALRSPQLEVPAAVADAYGRMVAATVSILRELNQQIATLAAELQKAFEKHPDAKFYLSQPGLGTVLGARVLAEFGDDRTRFLHPKARKNYAGTSPITKASGLRRVVLARVARNQRLADACYLWAFSAIRQSAGARGCYDAHRGRGNTHPQALRALANRLVGILHGCLQQRPLYEEQIAWRHLDAAAA